MARFEEWMTAGKRRHRRILSGYQNVYNDRGNWTGGDINNGHQIGTNRSISAPTLKSWLNREPSLGEMKNLSIDRAKQIYRVKYWDKIQGDRIKSQILAEFLADMRSSAGGAGVKSMQKALNQIGKKVRVDGLVGNETLSKINSSNEVRLYNAFREEMIVYYKRIGIGSNSNFLKNWLSSLNKDYPPCSSPKAWWLYMLLIISFLGSIVYFLYKMYIT